MSSKGGCGCGGTATRPGAIATTSHSGDCGCGGACKADSYVRPRFFAGQLLTEEDLELLGEYVTAKNRLHNRNFFGDGVVCGLEVSCHPCGGGRVIVRPGHALDCCGNDIVVPCEADLDVNAMIHRLRVDTLGGYDCGDPCPPPAAQAVPTPGRTEAPAGSRGIRETKDPEPEVLPPAARRYSLYVRYCEEATEPVAPYATGEPCGDDGCEPSRVREGYRFELGCPVDRPDPDDFVMRVRACIEDFYEDRLARRRSLWEVVGRRMQSAVQGTKQPPEFTDSDASALKASTQRLSTFAERREEAEKEGVALEPEDVRRHLDDLRAIVMTSARLNVLPAEQGQVAIERYDLREPLRQVTPIAHAVAEAIEPHIDKSLDDELDRVWARALVEEGPRFTERAAVADAPDSVRVQLAIEGTPMTRKSFAVYERSLADVREWLLKRLDQATFLTDCALRRDVERIVVAEPSPGDVGTGRVTLATDAGQALASALVRYLYGCVCAALLPPCSDCDDTAVLLATIEVDDCDVTHICNLERRIPLTGTAMRYWLPVEHLARLLDKVCCEMPRQWKPDPAEEKKRVVVTPVGVAAGEGKIHTVQRASAQERVFVRAEDEPRLVATASSLLRTAGAPPEQTERVSRAVSDVSGLKLREIARGEVVLRPVREPVGPAEPIRPAEPTEPAKPAEPPRPSDEVITEVATKAAEDATKGVRREIGTLKRSINSLKDRNSQLEKTNRELTRRVEKLGREG
jgi:hypothetical protein